MAIQQSYIDALTAALAAGERMVRKGDKAVEYRSVDELLARGPRRHGAGPRCRWNGLAKARPDN